VHAQNIKETARSINNKATESRYDEDNICKLPASKQGYIYIPFAAQDLVDQSLGVNLIRHLKGKNCTP